MGYREIRIYEEPWPSIDEMMFGPRKTPIPEPNWREKLLPGEVAVFFKNFKSGTSVNSEGKPIGRSSEICLAFSSRHEAEVHASDLVGKYPSIICELKDRDGKRLSTISNQRVLTRHGFASLTGLMIWAAGFLSAGFVLVWSVKSVVSWKIEGIGLWIGSSLIGAFLTAFVTFKVFMARQVWKFQKRARRMEEKFTLEERERFSRINQLSVSLDPEDREECAQLSREYFEKCREYLK